MKENCQRTITYTERNEIMEKIVIVIEEGLVRNVYSSKENVNLVILDLDTEEGQEMEKKTELPDYIIY